VKSFALPEQLVGVTFDDVTERRALEQRLRQAEKMDTVGRLAGGLAHDFNNVLTTIVAAASMLDEALVPGDPRRDDVRDILDAANRGAAMTRRLLTLSKRQPSEAKPLDLSEAVDGLKHLLRRLLGGSIDVVFELEHNLPAIVADSTEIEQVLLNLVINARQAMESGGRLLLRTRQVPRAIGETPWIELVVSDTGSGMDEATRQRIFEPFFTTKGEGTGLGLATVYGIVTQRGGEIDVASGRGDGTTFTIRFPAGLTAPETGPAGNQPGTVAS
jgi:signal transduction histidine kinase